MSDLGSILGSLAQRIQKHEAMRADPATGLVVVWNNGVPYITRQAVTQLPVAITGVSLSGQYSWKEVTYSVSGERFLSGAMMGGSGNLSGSNLMVEMNGVAIASGNFPVHTRAWRKSHTMTSQDVWEFSYHQSGGSVGGGGISGINLIDASGVRFSGIVNLTMNRADVTSGGALVAAATLTPRLATYDLDGMWKGVQGGQDQTLLGGKDVIKGSSNALAVRVSGAGGILFNDSAITMYHPLEGNFFTGNNSGANIVLSVSSGYGGGELIWTSMISSGVGNQFASITMTVSGVAPSSSGGDIPVGITLLPPTTAAGVYVQSKAVIDGNLSVLGDNADQLSYLEIGRAGGAVNPRFIVQAPITRYEGKTGSIGPAGNTVGGGIVSDLGSGSFTSLFTPFSGPGEFSMNWDNATAKYIIGGVSGATGGFTGTYLGSSGTIDFVRGIAVNVT